jgi:hypothetical protein
MDVLKHFDKEENFVCIEDRIRATRRKNIRSMLVKTKLVEVIKNQITCKSSFLIMDYSLPEYLQQIEELKEHQSMLKDLKNSRTLPILSHTSINSINLNDY